MKPSNLGIQLHIALGSALLLGVGALAQMPGAGGPAGLDTALLKLFGDIKAFTAKAQVQVLDSSQQEVISMPMDFALLDGNVRIDMDLTQAKGNSMPPGATDSLKQMGMSQLFSITRRDKKVTYVGYPGPKMLLTMPMEKDKSSSDSDTKIEKTAQDKETIDGHPCVKNKVVFRDDAGKSVEAVTWNATDLKDFPLQIQAKEKENTSVMRFSQVQLTKPDAKQFEPPTGYTQYSNQQDLIQGIMLKMGAAVPKK
jgi:hypothetical protein